MSSNNPISPKAMASTGGASIGAAAATLVVWLLGITLWGASSAAGDVADALAAVPAPVSALIAIFVPGIVAAISSWSVSDPNRVTNEQLHELQALR